MSRFAAFDIGTNNVLLAVADRLEDGRWSPVLDRGEITRLGEGVDRTGILSPEAIQRTVAVLARFAEEARSLGAERLAAAATSASRDAKNGMDLVEAARRIAGVEVEIISGQREAELVFRAVQGDFGEPGRPLVAVDIGGGSTEVIYGEHTGLPSFRTSLQIGSVRLTERHVHSHPIPIAERGEVR
ncbi:MAG: Ppx/GppA family phosphatase, partial [Myxococcaceae bacterium]